MCRISARRSSTRGCPAHERARNGGAASSVSIRLAVRATAISARSTPSSTTRWWTAALISSTTAIHRAWSAASGASSLAPSTASRVMLATIAGPRGASSAHSRARRSTAEERTSSCPFAAFYLFGTEFLTQRTVEAPGCFLEYANRSWNKKWLTNVTPTNVSNIPSSLPHDFRVNTY